MPAFLIFDRGSEVFPLRVLVVNPDFLQICPRDGDRNGIARAMSMFISCLLAGLGYEWEIFRGVYGGNMRYFSFSCSLRNLIRLALL